MFRPRVIPVLLTRDNGLVKTRAFRKPTYIGDPINAVRIYNELDADELIVLDIRATAEGRTMSPRFVADVGDEARMPFAVGGGLRTLEDIRGVLAAGAERVVIGTAAVERPGFVAEAVERFGSSTIIVCIDVKRTFLGSSRVCTNAGSRSSSLTPEGFAVTMAQMGVGELVVQSIDRDGAMTGYDLDLTRRVADAVPIPVVALGGAGSLSDMQRALREGHAKAVAAGSMFVFHGTHRGVLISYPSRADRTFTP